jgi:transposase
LLKAYPREYRGNLRALVADIWTLDPEVWHKDWNLKRRHELAFEYGHFLTKKQVERLLACPEHPRSSQ